MARKKDPVQTDNRGHCFVEVPSSNGSGKTVRVSLLSGFYTPPVDRDGKVDLKAAAEELQEEIVSGTLQFRSYLESGELGLPVQVKVGSKAELEALIRAIRAVFKEGIQRSNDVRRSGLERCQSLLEGKEEGAVDIRTGIDRRSSDRRGGDRRVWYRPPEVELRKSERRTGSDRRAKKGRQVA